MLDYIYCVHCTEYCGTCVYTVKGFVILLYSDNFHLNGLYNYLTNRFIKFEDAGNYEYMETDSHKSGKCTHPFFMGEGGGHYRFLFGAM